MTAVPTSAPSIADIERWGRLDLPASAQEVKAFVDTGGLDALVVLTFKIPTSDLPSFLSAAGYSTPLEPPDSTLFIPGYYEEFDRQLPGKPDSAGLSWWPSRADWDRMLADPNRMLLSGHVLEPSFARKVLVDQTEERLPTIYLVHFEL